MTWSPCSVPRTTFGPRPRVYRSHIATAPWMFEVRCLVATHEIGSAVSGTKTVHHPTQGPLRYEYVTFQANDDPRLKLAAFIPC